METIQFGNSKINFTLRRSANRSGVAITVMPDGSVTVVAPKGVRRARVSQVVAKKADWIITQQESFRGWQKGFPKEFVSGESFYYLGRQYKLKIKKRKIECSEVSTKMIRGQLEVEVPDSLDSRVQARLVREAVVNWYKPLALKHLCAVTDKYARMLGVEYKSLKIREMHKRWGSGGRTGKLAFNWRVIMAPKRLVEYVVAHEVCHLKYDDHSERFWSQLARLMPDYERRRTELANEGAKYDVTLLGS